MVHKIIIDTDPGVDDAAALLFAHLHPEIDLVGVTTIFGNAGIDKVTTNALFLKKEFGFDAPVARGASRALVRVPGPAPAHVHGYNGLGDIGLGSEPLPGLDARPAHAMIAELVRAHPGEVTLVAIGRMTNLAIAISHDPEIVPLAKGVIIMGGAFSLGGPNGNVTPVAEANIIGDPDAADQVFGAHWPVSAIGLDVTRKTVLSGADFDTLAQAGPRQALLRDLTQGYLGYHERFGIDGCYVHDSSALSYLVRPDLFSMISGAIRVSCAGVTEGQTVVATGQIPLAPNGWDNRPIHQIAADVDHQGLHKLMMEVLSRKN